MLCNSLSTCSYAATDLLSTTLLTVAGTRLFQPISDITRVTRPLSLSFVFKALSLVPYYLSSGVQEKHNHPLSGAGYPGLMALASGLVSKNIGQKFPTLNSDLFVGVSSSLISVAHSFFQNKVRVTSFCNAPKINITKGPSFSLGSLFGFFPNLMMDISLIAFGNRVIRNYKSGISPSLFTHHLWDGLVPAILAKAFLFSNPNDESLQSGAKYWPKPNDLPIFLGMMLGHLTSEPKDIVDGRITQPMAGLGSSVSLATSVAIPMISSLVCLSLCRPQSNSSVCE